ncbi:BZ3500_MvSof-1268-A1-R1_Chr5-3g08144 [Microbotryum saponariae]|uniref:BZ3500_MvSof-1268-A1-R1_Chr5-3g08144 protein n=1 Tax=Microbotryum saponariae TaxID=289078 RepID=A0A2X0M724_9BASI|nr:BZ3500_MvSof-1268-A1-R1_Chr5-3g08144 [Microbotryum saponariae]SDA07903.1 BZ3501_MvSof-1269-A2-R1_Chr5-1g07288 [Microbotryum saponariae]
MSTAPYSYLRRSPDDIAPQATSASPSPWRYRSILELLRVRRPPWYEETRAKSNFRGYTKLCLVGVTSTIFLVLLVVYYAGHAGSARLGSLSSSQNMVEDTNGEIWPSKAARDRLLPPRVVVGQPWSRMEKIATAAGEEGGSEKDVIVTRYLGEKEDSPLVDSQIHHGLSIHGHRIDAMYEYETSDLGVYLTTLETFIRDHLPTRDSDEDDPSSLINAMRAYFPLKEQRSQKQPIPLKLFRTGKTFQFLMEGKRLEYLSSFNRLNPGISYHDLGLNTTSHWDAAADTWVRNRFECDRNQKIQGKQGIVEAWDILRLQKPVLKADFWRYLIVASEGGWYADEDLEALRPFAEWGLPQGVDEQKPQGFTEASLVVGIEADLSHYALWAKRFVRPIQIVQWGFGAARGHPVTIDAMRRVYNKIMELKPGQTVDVLLITGPGPWTSAVFGWLLARNGRTWVDFHGVPYSGWRDQDPDTGELGDTRIMPLTAMTPDKPSEFYPGSRGRDHYAAMSVHHFDGSWRDKRPSGKAAESQGATGPGQPPSKSTRA